MDTGMLRGWHAVGVRTDCSIEKVPFSAFLLYSFRIVAIQKRKRVVKTDFFTFREVFSIFTLYFMHFTIFLVIFGMGSFKVTCRKFG